jgi:hypothetical protein
MDEADISDVVMALCNTDRCHMDKCLVRDDTGIPRSGPAQPTRSADTGYTAATHVEEDR